jgi:hypothetical protein
MRRAAGPGVVWPQPPARGSSDCLGSSRPFPNYANILMTYLRRDSPSIVCRAPERPTEIRLGFAFSATGIASVRTPFS